jgi:hypothetical protein
MWSRDLRAPPKGESMTGNRRHTVLTVVLTAAVLVGGANFAAYAANGKPLLLGKSNVATKTSKVKNKGDGPALSLKSKPSSPSLAVSSSAKVGRLNADLLDGLDSQDLTTNTTILRSTDFTTVYSEQKDWFVNVETGTYLLSFNAGLEPVEDGPALCGFFDASDGGRSFGWASSVHSGGYSGVWLSASSVQTFTEPKVLNFFCSVDVGNFRLEDAVGLQIEVTEINDTTLEDLPVPVRSSSGRSGR